MNTYWIITDDKLSQWEESLAHDFSFKAKHRLSGAMCKQAQVDVLIEVLSMIPIDKKGDDKYAIWRQVIKMMIKQVEAYK
jgi:hypothetical protein